ncbi:hypothetical protein L3V83_07800 [Thiotrichales bacterium 19X7-9]|nr:hypothetical protein [Thiotrichales bacterium 19X7-9]
MIKLKSIADAKNSHFISPISGNTTPKFEYEEIPDPISNRTEYEEIPDPMYISSSDDFSSIPSPFLFQESSTDQSYNGYLEIK